MENLYNNTDINWVQVTDPSTGYVYYVPTTSLYSQKNGGTYSQIDGVYISNTLINAIVYTGSFSDFPYIEFYKGDGTTFTQSLNISSASSSFAESASYAITASYALNGGGSIDTGSLLLTASFSDPNLTFTKGDGSNFSINLSSLTVTSSLTASYIDGGTF
jgi:hypothetical protein